MVIRSEQRATFSRTAAKTFDDRIIVHLDKCFPAQCKTVAKKRFAKPFVMGSSGRRHLCNIKYRHGNDIWRRTILERCFLQTWAVSMDTAQAFRLKTSVVLSLMGFSSVMAACAISFRDQVLLIELGEAVPPPGSSSVSTLRGARLDCSTFGPLQIVRPIGAKLYFVLDPRRVFHRWDVTGATYSGNSGAGLENYISVYRATPAWTLWTYYGHAPFFPEEIAGLGGKL
jgi:hypothetical protein